MGKTSIFSNNIMYLISLQTYNKKEPPIIHPLVQERGSNKRQPKRLLRLTRSKRKNRCALLCCFDTTRFLNGDPDGQNWRKSRSNCPHPHGCWQRQEGASFSRSIRRRCCAAHWQAKFLAASLDFRLAKWYEIELTRAGEEICAIWPWFCLLRWTPSIFHHT